MRPGRQVLMAVVLATLTAGRIAFGLTGELTHRIPVTDTINKDMRTHGSAMLTELRRHWCQEARLVGFVLPNKPRELTLVMTCSRWGEGAANAPAKQ